MSPARPGGRQCQWLGLRPAAQGSRREAGFPCAMCKWNQSCGQRALNPTWEGQPSPGNAPSPVVPSPAHPTGTRLLSLVPLGDARNLKGAVITGGVFWLVFGLFVVQKVGIPDVLNLNFGLQGREVFVVFLEDFMVCPVTRSHLHLHFEAADVQLHCGRAF